MRVHCWRKNILSTLPIYFNTSFKLCVNQLWNDFISSQFETIGESFLHNIDSAILTMCVTGRWKRAQDHARTIQSPGYKYPSWFARFSCLPNSVAIHKQKQQEFLDSTYKLFLCSYTQAGLQINPTLLNCDVNVADWWLLINAGFRLGQNLLQWHQRGTEVLAPLARAAKWHVPHEAMTVKSMNTNAPYLNFFGILCVDKTRFPGIGIKKLSNNCSRNVPNWRHIVYSR